MTRPFSLEKTRAQRRTLVALFILSLLGAQYGVQTFDSRSFAGTLPLLISLALNLYTVHALLSNAWSWNRLFVRPEAALDEYERHARNAAYARAFRSPWLLGALMLSFPLMGELFVTLSGEPSGEYSSLMAAIAGIIGVWSLPAW
ncbi:hypothetical protein ACFP81_00675 [Deinococcus lacus]|uniref:Uncharacterized protein n=1 Tax=Deinococcus lacus TaxID=392561 RepID=A0ABW1YB68_9DEIO